MPNESSKPGWIDKFERIDLAKIFDNNVDNLMKRTLKEIWEEKDLSTKAGRYVTGLRIGFTYARHHAPYHQIKSLEGYLNLFLDQDTFKEYTKKPGNFRIDLPGL